MAKAHQRVRECAAAAHEGRYHALEKVHGVCASSGGWLGVGGSGTVGGKEAKNTSTKPGSLGFYKARWRASWRAERQPTVEGNLKSGRLRVHGALPARYPKLDPQTPGRGKGTVR